MEDVVLEYIRYQKNEAGFYAPRHHHTCFELVYYISGRGRSKIMEKEYQYAGNTFSLIPPKVDHDEHAETDSTLLFFGFRYHDMDYRLAAGVYKDFQENIVLELIKKMHEEIESKRSLYAASINSYTQLLIIQVIRQYFDSKDIRYDDSVDYIKKYLEEHYNRKVDLKELSELSGYSYDWFRHVFKKKTGVSISQYILNQRLKHAANDLENTKKQVTQIALENNFSSSSQFIVQFKNYSGLTPTRYRTMYQNKENVRLKNS
ncbi:MAG: AraC family transcriptional regulator [Lachnospiraceae bacterium]|nr:AraC family transcriptional regulator [Lachnospiraceae bacterium]